MQKEAELVLRNAARLMTGGVTGVVSQKGGHANFVTETDVRVQEILEEGLTRLVPGSVFYAEEKENEHIGDRPAWIVDPIDGTMNFLRGLHHSAISVAFAQGGRVRMGIVYNPFRDEMLTAREGGGAFLNGKRVQCANTPFEKAVALYGTSPYNPALAHATFLAVEEVMLKTADVRRFGSAALDLAYVACGRADFFFEYSLSLWDFAAGALLVKEAGGVFRLLDGDAEKLNPRGAVYASSPTCDKKAWEIVSARFPGNP